MTYAYNYAKKYGNNILFRGYKDGKTILDRVPYQPTLYERTSDSNAEWRDIFGNPLTPIKFTSIKEAQDHVSEFKDVSNYEVFGNTGYEYQFLKEEFPSEIIFDFLHTKILIIDIETSVTEGFPDYNNPLEEILLITVKNRHDKKLITFSSRPTNDNFSKEEYVLCNDESHLLKSFICFLSDEKPDSFVGWNSAGFDIPYMTARMERVLGEDWVKRISPFGIYKWREVNMGHNRVDKFVDYYGISSLDYLDLYKKFGGHKHEEWKLDFVAGFELNAAKLETPYETFEEFYQKDFTKFVRYNRVDVDLVDKLDEKLKLLELVAVTAYRSKCNFEDVLGTVKMWDCKIHDYLIDRKIAVPNPKRSVSDFSIVGAYVKEPLAGRYEWEVSVDAESLYPCIMMSWNISPDTIQSYMMDSTVDKAIKRNMDLSILSKENNCMTVNGAVFTKNKRGFIPAIIEEDFGLRKKVKNEMKRLESELESLKLKYNNSTDKEVEKIIEKLEGKITKLDLSQKSVKLSNNSLYGASGNAYFRFFDRRIAEGITMTGQMVTKTCEIAANEVMNKMLQTKEKDYVIMSHTDSLFINMGDIVKKYLSNVNDDNAICDKIDKIVKDKVTPAINKACAEITSYTNSYENKLNLKREKIGRYGIHLPAKNRYAVMVLDNEGVRYAKPKLSVTGLEIVRSSTPGNMKVALKEALEKILISNEEDVQSFILEEKDKFLLQPIEKIAFPKGCNGVSKWSETNHPKELYKSGCPIHVRAAILHNSLINKHGLEKNYPLIRDGDKIKFVYLREPNTIRENIIGFKGKLPHEFNLNKYIDYELMWQKTFLDPLQPLLDVVGWKAEKNFDLGDLFD